jgi:hypothetical protein
MLLASCYNVDKFESELFCETEKKIILLDYIGIEGTRFCSEISLTRTVLTA